MDMTLESQAQTGAVPDKLQLWGPGHIKISLAPITTAKPSKTKSDFNKSAFHAYKPALTSTVAGKIGINSTSNCKSLCSHISEAVLGQALS